MTDIKCQWCKGMQTPFHKINVYMYGNHRFICEKCYKELEQQQLLFDNYFKEKE